MVALAAAGDRADAGSRGPSRRSNLLDSGEELEEPRRGYMKIYYYRNIQVRNKTHIHIMKSIYIYIYI